MMQKQKKHISIRINLIVQILLFVIPIILSLLVSNILALRIITERTEKLNSNTLGLFMKNTEERLKSVDQCLYKLMVYDSDIDDMQRNQDENRNWLSVTSLNRTLNEDLFLLSVAEGIFVYVEPIDICANVRKVYGYYQDQEIIKQYAREKHQLEDFETSYYNRTYWQLHKIGGVEYLMVDISSRDVCMGAYISVQGYLNQLDNYTEGQFDYLYLKDAQGNVWGNTQPENMDEYLEIAVSDQKDQYTLVGLVKRDTMMSGLTRWQIWILIAAIMMTVLLVFFMLRYITKEIILPVGYFNWAMQKVRDGDLSVRVGLQSRFQEFADMALGFNGMVERIEKLKINVYEEQLKKQQAQLHFLQLQSSPHYYLNSMNVLYSLALKKDWTLLKEMILILSKHSRYLLKNADAQVRLQDELEHVSDYVWIQQQRFSHSVKYEVEVQEELMDCMVPALLLQTFVENAFKYGISTQRVLDMHVRISRMTRKGRSVLCLTMDDKGQGFDEKVLFKIRNGERIIDDFGREHYGIENIRQRLELIYGTEHTFIVKNNEDGGAEIKIEIPERREV